MSAMPPWRSASPHSPERTATTFGGDLKRLWRGSEDVRRTIKSTAVVIHALILREALTRYGRRSAGFLWAIVQPVTQLVALLLIFAYLRHRTPAAGESLTIFLMTGIMPVFLVRGGLRQGAGAIASNRGLMIYRKVGAFEVITARQVLELTISLCVVLCVMVFMKVFHGLAFHEWVDRGFSLLQALAALACLAYGLSYLSAQIGRMFDQWRDFSGILGRILFFTSGVWFTLDSLPPAIRKWAVLNPLAHVIEWIRDAALPTFSSLHVDHLYPFQFGLTCLFIGLFIDWLHQISGYDLVAGRRR